MIFACRNIYIMVKLNFIAGLIALGSGAGPLNYELTNLKELFPQKNDQGAKPEEQEKVEKSGKTCCEHTVNQRTAVKKPHNCCVQKQVTIEKSNECCESIAKQETTSNPDERCIPLAKQVMIKNSEECCAKKFVFPPKIKKPEERKRSLTRLVEVDGIREAEKPNEDTKKSMPVVPKKIDNAEVEGKELVKKTKISKRCEGEGANKVRK